jgi:single-strand DNA-binding protein
VDSRRPVAPAAGDEEEDMSEAIVTIQGWLGADPVTYTAGDGSVTKFRVAHTPRRYRRTTGEWYDGETQWYSVSAWRLLGSHCQRSLHKGDPVVVQGRLGQRTYTNREGVDVVTLELEALTVGHDLSLGISLFSRTVGAGVGRESRPGDATAEAPPAPDTPAPEAPASWSPAGDRAGNDADAEDADAPAA